MQITSILPANMPGHAGERIDEFSRFWKQTNGVFRADVPDFRKLLLYSPHATGESIPRMGYLGPESFISQIMNHRFGSDYSASIKAADSNFDRSVAPGFVPAASGFAVSELIEMEVTPPGSLQALSVRYLRHIERVQMGILPTGQPKFVLAVLTLPTDDFASRFLPARGYPGGDLSKGNNRSGGPRAS